MVVRQLSHQALHKLDRQLARKYVIGCDWGGGQAHSRRPDRRHHRQQLLPQARTKDGG